MERAVPEESEASGVGSDVSSDVARALGSEVEGHHVAVLGNLVVKDLKDAAGVGGENACGER